MSVRAYRSQVTVCKEKEAASASAVDGPFYRWAGESKKKQHGTNRSVVTFLGTWYLVVRAEILITSATCSFRSFRDFLCGKTCPRA